MRRLLLPMLLLVTAAAYLPVLAHDFIVVDDPRYLIVNPYVRDGISLDGIRWALTSVDAANWFPLTWLSHMVDVELFGLEPAGHHATALLLHVLNTGILFLALRRMTGRDWESAVVAALFALHPLHVESVAWVAERKDVLSTFFWFLGLWAYAVYAERPGALRYLAVLVAFALGLASKQMLVTFPFVLLLLDWWPLGRMRERFADGDPARLSASSAGRLVVEKIPFFVLSIAASLITLTAQQPGVEHSAEALPLLARTGNALVSYAAYAGKMLWPVDLAAYYPHPKWVPLGQVLLAGAIVLPLSLLAIVVCRRGPPFAVGWFWYLGTLVPVIGIVQVGDQGMADRYTYVPLVGLFIALVFVAAELLRRWRVPQLAMATGTVAVLAILGVLTWRQAALWKNTETLYRHTLSVTEANAFAHATLATALQIEGRNDEAEEHLLAALAIEPNDAETLNTLGGIVLERGDLARASELYTKAVEVGPWLFDAQVNLGLVREEQGDVDGAIEQYQRASQINPEWPTVEFLLGRAFETKGDLRQAVAHYQQAARLEPGEGEYRQAMARVKRRLRTERAASE